MSCIQIKNNKLFLNIMINAIAGFGVIVGVIWKINTGFAFYSCLVLAISTATLWIGFNYSKEQRAIRWFDNFKYILFVSGLLSVAGIYY